MGYTITDHLGSIWALAYEDGTFIEKYAGVNPDFTSGIRGGAE